MSEILQPNYTILFQGDSITDCGRNRLDSSSLGNGYVNLINYYIQQHLPEYNITCINKGISGNRTTDLQKRWKKSTLSIAKEIDVLSLLIGINDTWRRYDTGLITTVTEFREHYNYFLSSIKEANPEIKIILLSPFVLPTEPEQLKWHEDLLPKIEVIDDMVEQYETFYIPLQEAYNSVITIEKPNCYWAYDGVHPSAQGHILIAKEWISIV